MAEKMRYELISWSGTQRLCLRLAALIKASGYRPDVVIAIARGGYVPARLICDHLGVMALTSIKIEHYLSATTKHKQAEIHYPLCVDIKDQHVLLVDDVNDSGDTLEVAINHLQTFQPHEIRTAVMHHKVVTHLPVDYYAKKIIKWRWLIYPWAVTEDVSVLLQQLSPAPKTIKDSQQQLFKIFGISLSQRHLKDIYACLE